MKEKNNFVDKSRTPLVSEVPQNKGTVTRDLRFIRVKTLVFLLMVVCMCGEHLKKIRLHIVLGLRHFCIFLTTKRYAIVLEASPSSPASSPPYIVSYMSKTYSVKGDCRSLRQAWL